MADPDTYILLSCTECGTLILKPQGTTTSTFAAPSRRSKGEKPKMPRHTAGDGTAICSQCRGKTEFPAKDHPK
jgi:hypothetical protein